MAPTIARGGEAWSTIETRDCDRAQGRFPFAVNYTFEAEVTERLTVWARQRHPSWTTYDGSVSSCAADFRLKSRETRSFPDFFE